MTVTDAAVKDFLCRTLDNPVFDEQAIRNGLKSIIVKHDGSFDIIHRQEPILFMTL